MDKNLPANLCGDVDSSAIPYCLLQLMSLTNQQLYMLPNERPHTIAEGVRTHAFLLRVSWTADVGLR